MAAVLVLYLLHPSSSRQQGHLHPCGAAFPVTCPNGSLAMARGEDLPQHSVVPQLPAVCCDGQIQSQLQAESGPSHSFLWSLTPQGQSPEEREEGLSVISLQVLVPDFLLPLLCLSNTKDQGTGRGTSVHMAELWVPWQPLPTALHAGLTWHSGTPVFVPANGMKLLNEKCLIFPFLQHQRQCSEQQWGG